MNTTKVMISGEWQKVMQKAARWPCGVCGSGVGNNSVQHTSCQKSVHKKCRMYKVMNLWRLRKSSNRYRSHKCNIDVNANLEDGDADAAVKARIRIGLYKFRHLVPLLTRKDASLIVRGRLYVN